MTESVFLVVENDDGTREEVSIDQSAHRLVGRSRECEWRSHSPFVSRRHCLFVIDPPYVTVRDLNSLNGTYVNGHRIDGEYDLALGDVVQVGSMKWEVCPSAWKDDPNQVESEMAIA